MNFKNNTLKLQAVSYNTNHLIIPLYYHLCDHISSGTSIAEDANLLNYTIMVQGMIRSAITDYYFTRCQSQKLFILFNFINEYNG